MKMLMALLVGSVMTTGFLAADPTKENCPCRVCKCTEDNHCGCMTPNKNCSNGDDSYLSCQCGSGCKCGNRK